MWHLVVAPDSVTGFGFGRSRAGSIVTLNHAEALAGCARGDRQALKSLFDTEAGRLVAVAQRIVRRRDLAEEIVQEAFIQIWRKAHQYSPDRGSARGWIYAVVRNRALNVLRDGGREELAEETDLDALRETATVHAADDVLSRLDQESRLRQCLEALDEHPDGVYLRLHPRRNRGAARGPSRNRQGVGAPWPHHAAGVHGMTSTPLSASAVDRAEDYVLGLLDAREEAAVEEEIERDPALRAAVARARDRFHELDLAAQPVAITPGLWQRIESALPTSWRIAALSGMAAAGILAAALLVTPAQQPQAQVVAVLIDDAGEPLAIVEDYGDRSSRVTPLAEIDVPADRTMQVWTLPNEDLGPVSLGLLDRSQTTLLDNGPALPLPQPEQLYEITIEQEGGSPTGRPTGPIVGKGFAKRPL
jgi:RNA polymerase sigma factor (sigma-70 family)